MDRSLGSTDVFNSIVQKVDEALIQAGAHFRAVRTDNEDGKSAASVPDVTVVPSRKDMTNSERSCSPNPLIASSAVSSTARSRVSTAESRRSSTRTSTGTSSGTSTGSSTRTSSGTSTGSSTGSSSGILSDWCDDIKIKNNAYLGIDKKKAIVVTSVKSKKALGEEDVAKIQKLIDDLFGKDATISGSSTILL